MPHTSMQNVRDMLRQPVHVALNPSKRRAGKASVSSTPFDPARVYPRTVLSQLQYNYDFFEHAASQLESVFDGLPSDTYSCNSDLPGNIESRLLRRTVLESDTQANFTLAVAEPVAYALELLWPGLFALQSGDGKEDVTDDAWLCGESFVVNTEFKTKTVFSDTHWRSIDELVQSGVFPWPAVKTQEKPINVLGQVWGQMTSWGVQVSMLSTDVSSMFFYRPLDSSQLLCSRLYKHSENATFSIRFMLASVLLAAANERGLLGVTLSRVRFGNLPPSTSSALQPSSLQPSPLQVHMVHVPTNAYAHVFASLPGYPVTDHHRADACYLAEKSTITLRALTKLHDVPLMAYRRVTANSNTEHRPVQTHIPLPPTATEATADIFLHEHIAHNRIGFVAMGRTSAGECIVGKCSNDCRGWMSLAAEAERYEWIRHAGLQHTIPSCYGLFQNDLLTFLVVGYVGTAVVTWDELNDKQWTSLVTHVHAFHTAGFHHGDLERRNICVDEDGRVCLIDLANVEKCNCKEGSVCSELRELEEMSGRDCHFVL